MSNGTRTIVVTGTDTGVGKSLVTAAAVYTLRAAGIDAVGLKPIETGVPPEPEPGDELRSDGELQRWAGGEVLSLSEVSPYRFRTPVAPVVAARLDGRTLELEDLLARIERIRSRAAVTVIEGAGGLLVPVTDRHTFAELAQALGADLLVVAANRLGVLNHLSLTLEVIRERGLACAGVVINETLCDRDDAAVQTNLNELQKVADRYRTSIVAHLPYMPGISARAQVQSLHSARELDALARLLAPEGRQS